MIRTGRRAILGAALLSLGGCGFRPVYGPAAAGRAGASEELAAVAVGPIPERTGQLLRLALQDRLERGATAVAQRYDLTVTLGVNTEGLAIQTGYATSRVRLIGSASWVLTAQDPGRSTLKTGFAREVDGYNVFNNQFFASDLEGETVQRRMMDALAEQVTMQLAMYFQQRAAKS